MNRSTASRTLPGPPPLGEFGVEEGLRSALSVIAPAFAVAGVCFAAVRPLGLENATWATRAAILCGVVAIAVGVVGSYRAATRGIGGGRRARMGIGIGVVAAVYAHFDGAVRDGTFRPSRFVKDYLDWEVIQAVVPDFLRGLVNTLKYAAFAQIVAIVVGLVIANLALSPKRRLRWPAVTYVDAVRGTPIIVLTLLIGFGLTSLGIVLDFFTAITTILAVNASAYIAEIFRAGIQSIPRGQMDAARSLGMPQETAMMSVIIPQAVRSVIPPLVSEFIALVKDSAIVAGTLGTTLLSRELYQVARTSAASTFRPTAYLLVVPFYLIITVPAARLVGRLERRLRAGLS